MTVTIEYPLKSANGRNWPGIVVIHPDAPFKAAVWAQEFYEAQAKLNPLTLLRTRLSKSARRDMEITGHEIEVCAAAMWLLGLASASAASLLVIASVGYWRRNAR